MPLSPDELYYWVWSRALAPGYLDHPPMVALWIWLGTALAGDTALGVRLLAPVSAALGTMLLARAGETLFPGRGAGLRAAVLLNATLMLGAGAVTLTPDTPLLFFWTVAAWALARLAAGGAGWWWLAVGAAAGLGLDSKYTAALLGPGIALWLLAPAMRQALRSAWPWAGGGLAVLLFLPVLEWNAGHGWVSFIKQGGRAGAFDPSRAVRFEAELAAGQLGLATPLLFVLLVAGVFAAARRWREPTRGLVAALVLPGAAVFVQHALGDRVQANWAAVLYPGAALAASVARPRLLAALFRPGVALGAVLTAAIYLQAAWGPLPLPRSLDPTLRLAGWHGLARDAAVLARRSGATFLAGEEYGLAASMAWSAPAMPVLGAEPRWTLFALPAAAAGPDAGLLLVSTRRREPPDPAIWSSAEPLELLPRRRDTGQPVEAETYRAFRVVLRPGAAAVRLPTPFR